MTIIVIQARTNSKRLAGKSLLHIGGMPLAVLASKRASNTGIDIIFTTSNEESDNALAHTAEQHNLKVFRGDLNNVLKRFITALESKDDNEIIVRLTADNPLPDGHLIEEAVEEFKARSLRYLSSERPPESQMGLPIGLSLEAVSYTHLTLPTKA